MKATRLYRLFLMGLLSVTCILCHAAETDKSGDLNWLEQYNVVWTTQSTNSGESMPCSGGDIGLNVWVETDELLVYMGQTTTTMKMPGKWNYRTQIPTGSTTKSSSRALNGNMTNGQRKILSDLRFR